MLALTTLGCPSTDPDGDIPSCEELSCQGGAVCLDGACRSRACLETNCVSGTVCQGGPLCLPEAEVTGPSCGTLSCPEGTACETGPICRDAEEDLDGDGVRSQLDCDDGQALRFPGNSEVCDGLDNDCNGDSDDDAPCMADQRCCGTAGCIDLQVNREHCGTCGRACAIYEECVEGQCLEADAPVITSVSPDPLPTGLWLGPDEEIQLFIRGEHMVGFATVFLESSDGREATPFEVLSTLNGRAYTIDQPLRLDGADLPGGEATMRVERNDGVQSEPFTVTIQGAVPPEITSVSPSPIPLAEEVSVSVYGTGFWGSPRVEIAAASDPPDWLDLPVEWVTETWVRTSSILLDPAQHPPGAWLARVINPDGEESAWLDIEVEPAPAPALTNIAPTEAPLGERVTLELHGFDIYGQPTVLMAPAATPEETLPPIEVASADTRLLVTQPLLLDPRMFSAQDYVIRVVNPDGTPSNDLRFVVLE